MTYNGWKNYETWCVNLWLINEEPSQRYWSETAIEVYQETEPTQVSTKLEAARYELADRLKDAVEEGNPLADGASMYSDLLQAAMREVDWDRISELLIEGSIEELTSETSE